jgi:hypothetical protein
MEEVSLSSSSEELFFSKKTKKSSMVPTVVLPATAKKPDAESQFSPGREVARSVSVSRMSALREMLETQGESFVHDNLEPLSRDRQFFERQDRVLTLQLKWARLYGASPAMTREEMVRCHTAELDELAETFVLAYADYLAQRLSAPEQER